MKMLYIVLLGLLIAAPTAQALEGTTTDVFQDWAPLLLAFGVLAIATMREKTNYFAVIVAGAFFVYVAFSAPWASERFSMMVALFGSYNALLGIIEVFVEDGEKENGVDTHGED